MKTAGAFVQFLELPEVPALFFQRETQCHFGKSSQIFRTFLPDRSEMPENERKYAGNAVKNSDFFVKPYLFFKKPLPIARRNGIIYTV